jgi:hypothetical protein
MQSRHLPPEMNVIRVFGTASMDEAALSVSHFKATKSARHQPTSRI